MRAQTANRHERLIALATQQQRQKRLSEPIRPSNVDLPRAPIVRLIAVEHRLPRRKKRSIGDQDIQSPLLPLELRCRCGDTTSIRQIHEKHRHRRLRMSLLRRGCFDRSDKIVDVSPPDAQTDVRGSHARVGLHYRATDAAVGAGDEDGFTCAGPAGGAFGGDGWVDVVVGC